jgi:hypothetical protein
MDHIAVELTNYSIYISVIVDTHLKKKHLIVMEAMEGYTTYRRDRREGRREGGVAVYVAIACILLSATL